MLALFIVEGVFPRGDARLQDLMDKDAPALGVEIWGEVNRHVLSGLHDMLPSRLE
jgi:hypothetical protein